MGKCWMVELENDMDHDELDFEIDSLIDVYHVKINDYPSNPLEPIREIWEKWKDKNRISWSDQQQRDAEAWYAMRKCMAIVEGK